MKNLRQNSHRAKWAERLIQISAIVYILAVFYSVFNLILNYDIYIGNELSPRVIEINIILSITLRVLSLVVFIISAVTFIQWFRRAYYNQEAKFEYMSTTNGWATGAWFVPIMNLYKPYQMIKELFEEAEEYMVKFNLGLRKKSRFRVLAWWWGLLIGLRIATLLSARIQLISFSAERMMKIGFINILINLLYIFLAYLTIRFIRDYNQMEMAILSNSDHVEIKSRQNSELLDSHF